MTDPKVVEYVLAHLSDIWHIVAWCAGILFIVVCAIFGVLGRVGKAFLAKLLQFQADLLAEVKKIGGDCAETNAALRQLTTKHDALKESHDETKQELKQVWAVVTLKEVFEPQISHIHERIDEQKKTLEAEIRKNAIRDHSINVLANNAGISTPIMNGHDATERQA